MDSDFTWSSSYRSYLPPESPGEDDLLATKSDEAGEKLICFYCDKKLQTGVNLYYLEEIVKNHYRDYHDEILALWILSDRFVVWVCPTFFAKEMQRKMQTQTIWGYTYDTNQNTYVPDTIYNTNTTNTDTNTNMTWTWVKVQQYDQI